MYNKMSNLKCNDLKMLCILNTQGYFYQILNYQFYLMAYGFSIFVTLSKVTTKLIVHEKCFCSLMNNNNNLVKVKGKVFYGQEPPSGESTTTESGVNYQLLSVMHRSSPLGNSLLQSITTSYGQWRQRR